MAGRADIDSLVQLYYDDRKTLRFLQRLLYEPDAAARLERGTGDQRGLWHAVPVSSGGV